MSRLRAFFKIILLIAWILPCFIVGYLLYRTSRSLLRFWVRFFWKGICSILGIEITIKGVPLAISYRREKKASLRPIIFISNHISWLDIPILGSLIYASFVAKADMRSWPILGWACKLGQTLFVTRHRQTTRKEIQAMDKRLSGSFNNIILFPEGTSSDGLHCRPFKSSFFSLASISHGTRQSSFAQKHQMPLVQPVSLSYNGLNYLPVTFEQKSRFAWYGSMTLVPHIWNFLQIEQAHVTVTFSPPLEPSDYKNRKELSKKCFEIIANNAAFNK